MKTSLHKSMGHLEQAEESGWKGYHLAQALENERDLLLNACYLAQTLLLQGRREEADVFIQLFEKDDFAAYPYLQVLKTRLQVETQLAAQGVEAGHRAVELCDKGLHICREMDELRYHKSSFRVRRMQGLLQANEHCNIPKDEWANLERRLRPFPFLRFDLKLSKLQWTAEMGDTASVQAAAEKLLQRTECQEYHRRKIMSLVETVTASS